MEYCGLCPRGCRVDREAGGIGVCGETAEIRVARASLHMWEEPPITGEHGSGTVFFRGCPLHCIYCQNYEISGGIKVLPQKPLIRHTSCDTFLWLLSSPDSKNFIATGELSTGEFSLRPTEGEGLMSIKNITITVEELARVFLKLQEMGAENINLVTATQFVPGVREALIQAKKDGLAIPVVYNTSSYENVETLRMLDGLVDVYLPDLKYKSPELSAKYSNARDYFEVATKAIAEMYRQVGPSGDEPKMIVRHLCLPGYTEDSKAVIRYLWETYGDNIFLSIMSQYTPLLPSLEAAERKYHRSFAELKRKLTQAEYDEVVDFAADLGITKAFVQEDEAAEESFIPDFGSWRLEEFLKK